MKLLLLLVFLLSYSSSFARNVVIDSNINDFNLSGTKIYAYSDTTYLGVNGTVGADGLLSLEVPDQEVRFRVDYAGQHYSPSSTSSNVAIDFIRAVTINSNVGSNNLAGKRVYVFQGSSYKSINKTFGNDGIATVYLPNDNYRYRVDYAGQTFTEETNSTNIQLDFLHEVTLDSNDGDFSLTNYRAYVFNGSQYQSLNAKFDAQGLVKFFLPKKEYRYRIDFVGQHFSQTTSSANVLINHTREVTVNATSDKGLLVNKKVYVFNESGQYQNVWTSFDQNGDAKFRLPDANFKYRVDFRGQWFTPVSNQTTVDASLSTFGFRNVLIDGSANKEELANKKVYVFDASNKYLNVWKNLDANGQASFYLANEDYKYRVDYQGQWFTSLSNSTTVDASLSSFGFRDLVVDFSQDKEKLLNAKVYVFDENDTYQDTWAGIDINGLAHFYLPTQNYKFRLDYKGQWFTPVSNSSLVVSSLNDFGFRDVLIDASIDSAHLVTKRVYVFDENEVYQSEWASFDQNGQASFYLPNRDYKFRVDFRGQWFTPVTNADVVSVSLASFGFRNVNVDGIINKDLIVNHKVYVFSEEDIYENIYQTLDSNAQASFYLPNKSFKYRLDFRGQWFTQATDQSLVDISLATFGFRDVLIDGSADKESLVGKKVYVFDGNNQYIDVNKTFDSNGQATFLLANQAYKYRIDFQGQYFTALSDATTIDASLFSFGFRDVVLSAGTDKDILENKRAYVFDENDQYLGLWTTFDDQGFATFNLADKNYKFRIDYIGQWFTPLSNQTAIDASLVSFGFRYVAINSNVGSNNLAGYRTYVFDENDVYVGLWESFDTQGIASFYLPNKNYKYRVDYAGQTFTPATNQTSVQLDFLHEVTLDSNDGDFNLAGYRSYVFDGDTYQNLNTTFDAQGFAKFFLPNKPYRYRIDYSGQHFTQTTSDDLVAVSLTREVTIDSNIGEYNLAGYRVYVYQGTVYKSLNATFDTSGLAKFQLPLGTYRYRVDYINQYYTQETDQNYIALTNYREVTIDSNQEDGFNLHNYRTYVFQGSTYKELNAKFDASGVAKFLLPDDEFRYRVDYVGQSYTPPTSNTLVTVDFLHNVAINSNVGENNLAGSRAYVFNENNQYQSVNKTFNTSGFAYFKLPNKEYKYRIDYAGQTFTPVTNSELVQLDFLHTVTLDSNNQGYNLHNSRAYVYNGTSYQSINRTFNASGYTQFFLPQKEYRYRVDYAGQNYTATTSSNYIHLDNYREVVVDSNTDTGNLANTNVLVYKDTQYLSILKKFSSADGLAKFYLPEDSFRYRVDFDGQQFSQMTSSVYVKFDKDTLNFDYEEAQNIPDLFFTVDQLSISEANVTSSIIATISTIHDQDVTFTINSNSGGAYSNPITLLQTSAVITAGQLQTSIYFQSIDNPVPESNKSSIISITSVNEANLTNPNQAIVNIIDNDQQSELFTVQVIQSQQPYTGNLTAKVLSEDYQDIGVDVTITNGVGGTYLPSGNYYFETIIDNVSYRSSQTSSDNNSILIIPGLGERKVTLDAGTEEINGSFAEVLQGGQSLGYIAQFDNTGKASFILPLGVPFTYKVLYAGFYQVDNSTDSYINLPLRDVNVHTGFAELSNLDIEAKYLGISIGLIKKSDAVGSTTFSLWPQTYTFQTSFYGVNETNASAQTEVSFDFHEVTLDATSVTTQATQVKILENNQFLTSKNFTNNLVQIVLPNKAYSYNVIYSDGTEIQYPQTNSDYLTLSLNQLNLSFSSVSKTVSETQELISIPVSIPSPIDSDVNFVVEIIAQNSSSIDGVSLVTSQFSLIAGEIETSVFVNIVDDFSDEYLQSVRFKITTANIDLGINDEMDLSIIDDDPAPVINFLLSQNSVPEDVGTTSVIIKLYGETKKDIEFEYQSRTSSVTDLSVLPSGVLTIYSGSDQATIPMQIVDDFELEADELEAFYLVRATNAVIGKRKSHLLFIQDNDRNDQSTFTLSANITFESAVNTNPLTVVILDSESGAPILIQEDVTTSFSTDLPFIQNGYDIHFVMNYLDAPRVKSFKFVNSQQTYNLDFTVAGDAGGYINVSRNGVPLDKLDIEALILLNGAYQVEAIKTNFLGPLYRFEEARGQYYLAFQDGDNIINSSKYDFPREEIYLDLGDEIRAVVTDNQGLPQSGVIVSYFNTKTPEVLQQRISDENGEVFFNTLNENQYIVVANINGQQKTSFPLNPGDSYSFNSNSLLPPPLTNVYVTFMNLPFSNDLNVQFYDESLSPVGPASSVDSNSLAYLPRVKGLYHLTTENRDNITISPQYVFPRKGIKFNLGPDIDIKIRNYNDNLEGINVSYYLVSMPEFVQYGNTNSEGVFGILPLIGEEYIFTIEYGGESIKSPPLKSGALFEYYLEEDPNDKVSTINIATNSNIVDNNLLVTMFDESLSSTGITSYTSASQVSFSNLNGKFFIALRDAYGQQTVLNKLRDFPVESISYQMKEDIIVKMTDGDFPLINQEFQYYRNDIPSFIQTATTNEAGEFYIHTIEDTTYTVSFTIDNENQIESDLSSGDIYSFSRQFGESDSRLVIEGLDKSKTLQVDVYNQSGSFVQNALLDDSHQVTLSGLSGDYSFVLKYDGYAIPSETFNLPSIIQLALETSTFRINTLRNDEVYLLSIYNNKSENISVVQTIPTQTNFIYPIFQGDELEVQLSYLGFETESQSFQATSTIVYDLTQETYFKLTFQNGEYPGLKPGLIISDKDNREIFYSEYNDMGYVKTTLTGDEYIPSYEVQGYRLESIKTSLPQTEVIINQGFIQIIVQDNAGPLEGVTVNAFQTQNDSFVQNQQTDINGIAIIPTLENASYQVFIERSYGRVDSTTLSYNNSYSFVGPITLLNINQNGNPIPDTNVSLLNLDLSDPGYSFYSNNGKAGFEQVTGTYIVSFDTPEGHIYSLPQIFPNNEINLEKNPPVEVFRRNGSNPSLGDVFYYPIGFPNLKETLTTDINGELLIPTLNGVNYIVGTTRDWGEEIVETFDTSDINLNNLVSNIRVLENSLNTSNKVFDVLNQSFEVIYSNLLLNQLSFLNFKDIQGQYYLALNASGKRALLPISLPDKTKTINIQSPIVITATKNGLPLIGVPVDYYEVSTPNYIQTGVLDINGQMTLPSLKDQKYVTTLKIGNEKYQSNEIAAGLNYVYNDIKGVDLLIKNAGSNLPLGTEVVRLNSKLEYGSEQFTDNTSLVSFALNEGVYRFIVNLGNSRFLSKNINVPQALTSLDLTSPSDFTNISTWMSPVVLNHNFDIVQKSYTKNITLKGSLDSGDNVWVKSQNTYQLLTSNDFEIPLTLEEGESQYKVLFYRHHELQTEAVLELNYEIACPEIQSIIPSYSSTINSNNFTIDIKLDGYIQGDQIFKFAGTIISPTIIDDYHRSYSLSQINDGNYPVSLEVNECNITQFQNDPLVYEISTNNGGANTSLLTLSGTDLLLSDQTYLSLLDSNGNVLLTTSPNSLGEMQIEKFSGDFYFKLNYLGKETISREYSLPDQVNLIAEMTSVLQINGYEPGIKQIQIFNTDNPTLKVNVETDATSSYSALTFQNNNYQFIYPYKSFKEYSNPFSSGSSAVVNLTDRTFGSTKINGVAFQPTLQVFNLEGDLISESAVNSAGDFQFEGFSGPHYIGFNHEGHNHKTEVVLLPTNLNINLGRIRIEVNDLNGPAINHNFTFYDVADPSTINVATTNSEGYNELLFLENHNMIASTNLYNKEYLSPILDTTKSYSFGVIQTKVELIRNTNPQNGITLSSIYDSETSITNTSGIAYFIATNGVDRLAIKTEKEILYSRELLFPSTTVIKINRGDDIVVKVFKGFELASQQNVTYYREDYKSFNSIKTDEYGNLSLPALLDTTYVIEVRRQWGTQKLKARAGDSIEFTDNNIFIDDQSLMPNTSQLFNIFDKNMILLQGNRQLEEGSILNMGTRTGEVVIQMVSPNEDISKSFVLPNKYGKFLYKNIELTAIKNNLPLPAASIEYYTSKNPTQIKTINLDLEGKSNVINLMDQRYYYNLNVLNEKVSSGYFNPYSKDEYTFNISSSQIQFIKNTLPIGENVRVHVLKQNKELYKEVYTDIDGKIESLKDSAFRYLYVFYNGKKYLSEALQFIDDQSVVDIDNMLDITNRGAPIVLNHNLEGIDKIYRSYKLLLKGTLNDGQDVLVKTGNKFGQVIDDNFEIEISILSGINTYEVVLYKSEDEKTTLNFTLESLNICPPLSNLSPINESTINSSNFSLRFNIDGYLGSSDEGKIIIDEKTIYNSSSSNSEYEFHLSNISNGIQNYQIKIGSCSTYGKYSIEDNSPFFLHITDIKNTSFSPGYNPYKSISILPSATIEINKPGKLLISVWPSDRPIGYKLGPINKFEAQFKTIGSFDLSLWRSHLNFLEDTYTLSFEYKYVKDGKIQIEPIDKVIQLDVRY